MQVFWRIVFFYIVKLFILGLILRSDDDRLLSSTGANSKASPSSSPPRMSVSSLCLVATFYSSLYPEGYLAAPVVIAPYLGWKFRTWDWRLWIPAQEVDLTTNLRVMMFMPGGDDEKQVERTWENLPARIWHTLS
ncbi:hypothetical protein VTK26DRAFT_9168 [Humicola hyalothermophila]